MFFACCLTQSLLHRASLVRCLSPKTTITNIMCQYLLPLPSYGFAHDKVSLVCYTSLSVTLLWMRGKKTNAWFLGVQQLKLNWRVVLEIINNKVNKLICYLYGNNIYHWTITYKSIRIKKFNIRVYIKYIVSRVKSTTTNPKKAPDEGIEEEQWRSAFFVRSSNDIFILQRRTVYCWKERACLAKQINCFFFLH